VSLVVKVPLAIGEFFFYFIFVTLGVCDSINKEFTMKNFFKVVAVLALAVVLVHFIGWVSGIALCGGFMLGRS